MRGACLAKAGQRKTQGSIRRPPLVFSDPFSGLGLTFARQLSGILRPIEGVVIGLEVENRVAVSAAGGLVR